MSIAPLLDDVFFREHRNPLPWLMQGCCLERMAEIPEGSVDMILCDLPYGTTACKWDSVIPFEPLWTHYKRVCKKNAAIVLTASQPFTSALVMSNPADFKYCWVWEKNRPTNFAHAKNKPMKKHEDICVFSQGTSVHASQSDRRMPYNPQGVVDLETALKVDKKGKCVSDAHFSSRPSHGAHERKQTGFPHSILRFSTDMLNLHPTAKPVALMEYLIWTYTNPGETVLDNTMGSGTTGVACRNTGRRFIGIERDSGYFAVARERIFRIPDETI